MLLVGSKKNRGFFNIYIAPARLVLFYFRVLVLLSRAGADPWGIPRGPFADSEFSLNFLYRNRNHKNTISGQNLAIRAAPRAVRKAKSAEIEKFERKIASARAGARHVSWESPQLHARLAPKSPRPNPREFLHASMFMNVVANGNASSRTKTNVHKRVELKVHERTASETQRS